MEKRKKLLSAILSVSMIASAFTALPLSASAEGEQNSGEEVTATVSPSTTAGVTTTGEPVATATTEVESTDKPATAATPEATGVVYEDQKIKITNAKADKVTIVISKYYDNKTLAGVELKENVTLENGSGEVAYDLQGKAAKIMVWDDIKTMTPLFATTSVEGTVDPAPTVKPTAPTSQPETTPTAEPTATPTVKPTAEPTVTPTVSNKVEFTKDGDRVNAKIILDKPVSAENIKMYVVYKENDVLKRVETVNVNDDLTAEFTIPNELKNAEISVYIWNDKMNPYMDIQQITSLATKCRQLQKSHLSM